MEIGMKIYYDKETGNVILNTGEATGNVVETTVEQDFKSYIVLAERVPETVGVIQLEYGQLFDDFRNGSLVRVDPETKELLFMYPDPVNPGELPPPRLPLYAEIDSLKDRQDAADAAILMLMDM